MLPHGHTKQRADSTGQKIRLAEKDQRILESHEYIQVRQNLGLSHLGHNEEHSHVPGPLSGLFFFFSFAVVSKIVSFHSIHVAATDEGDSVRALGPD